MVLEKLKPLIFVLFCLSLSVFIVFQTKVLLNPLGYVETQDQEVKFANHYYSFIPWNISPKITNKIFQYSRILALKDETIVNLPLDGLIRLQSNTELSIDMNSQGEIVLKPNGRLELERTVEHTKKIQLQLDKQPLVTVDAGVSKIIVETRPGEEFGTIQVITGTIYFPPYTLNTGKQLVFRLNSETIAPSILPISAQDGQSLFANLDYGPPNLLDLQQMKLNLPLPYDEIHLPSSGIKKSLEIFDIRFSWEEVSGAQKYELQISKNLKFTEILFSGIYENNQALVNQIQTPGTYFWRVRPLATENYFSKFSKPRRFMIK